MLALLVLANLLWSLWRLIRRPGLEAAVGLIVAVALGLFFWYVRTFPLKVQDRLIRLEMRLRLREILPEDLAPRIGELTPDQLIGLRFASDGEMAGLVRQVLEGKLKRRDEIKRAIQDWQADYLRC